MEKIYETSALLLVVWKKNYETSARGYILFFGENDRSRFLKRKFDISYVYFKCNGYVWVKFQLCFSLYHATDIQVPYVSVLNLV